MADTRKSAKQTAARKAARERAVERAAEFRRRQEQLEELAVEYFVAVDAVDGINDAADAQVDVIRAKQAAELAAVEASAQDVVQRMLDTGVTRDEVAERLGVPVREVRRRRPAASSAADAAGTDPAVSDAAEPDDVQQHDEYAA
jgi:hypothetical protein